MGVMKTSMRRFVLLNVACVLALYLYGVLTDEPYWIEVGHGPGLYDGLLWLGLFVNGPSGFLAECLSWMASPFIDYDARFSLRHLLWSLLLWGQWWLYFVLARWTGKSVGRVRALNLFSVGVMLVGAVLAREAWLFGHRPSDEHVDRYYWFVRALGLAASGLMIFLCRWIASRSARSVPRRPDEPGGGSTRGGRVPDAPGGGATP